MKVKDLDIWTLGKLEKQIKIERFQEVWKYGKFVRNVEKNWEI